MSITGQFEASIEKNDAPPCVNMPRFAEMRRNLVRFLARVVEDQRTFDVRLYGLYERADSDGRTHQGIGADVTLADPVQAEVGDVISFETWVAWAPQVLHDYDHPSFDWEWEKHPLGYRRKA